MSICRWTLNNQLSPDLVHGLPLMVINTYFDRTSWHKGLKANSKEQAFAKSKCLFAFKILGGKTIGRMNNFVSKSFQLKVINYIFPGISNSLNQNLGFQTPGHLLITAVSFTSGEFNLVSQSQALIIILKCSLWLSIDWLISLSREFWPYSSIFPRSTRYIIT